MIQATFWYEKLIFTMLHCYTIENVLLKKYYTMNVPRIWKKYRIFTLPFWICKSIHQFPFMSESLEKITHNNVLSQNFVSPPRTSKIHIDFIRSRKYIKLTNPSSLAAVLEIRRAPKFQNCITFLAQT